LAFFPVRHPESTGLPGGDAKLAARGPLSACAAGVRLPATATEQFPFRRDPGDTIVFEVYFN